MSPYIDIGGSTKRSGSVHNWLGENNPRPPEKLCSTRTRKRHGDRAKRDYFYLEDPEGYIIAFGEFDNSN